MKNSIFRKTSLDHVSSPEQLNDYIRVTNPSVWAVLGAATLLLAAVLVWGFLGKLPTTVSASGVVRGNELVVYVAPDDAAELVPGANVSIGATAGTVREIGATPLSYAEVYGVVQSDYAVYQMNLSDWNVPVYIDTDGSLSEGSLVPVTITASEVRPIDFILN